jgi:hypothetical protein
MSRQDRWLEHIVHRNPTYDTSKDAKAQSRLGDVDNGTLDARRMSRTKACTIAPDGSP